MQISFCVSTYARTEVPARPFGGSKVIHLVAKGIIATTAVSHQDRGAVVTRCMATTDKEKGEVVEEEDEEEDDEAEIAPGCTSGSPQCGCRGRPNRRILQVSQQGNQSPSDIVVAPA